MSNEKKKRQPRLPANDRVRIEGQESTGWTVNWSRFGSCILVEGLFELGQQLSVEFPERSARGVAEVVWSHRFPDGSLLGLEFLRLERGAACRCVG